MTLNDTDTPSAKERRDRIEAVRSEETNKHEKDHENAVEGNHLNPKVMETILEDEKVLESDLTNLVDEECDK